MSARNVEREVLNVTPERQIPGDDAISRAAIDAIVAASPFPAFVIEGHNVRAANAKAAPILAAFAADATWGDAPIARIAILAASGRPAQTRISTRNAADPMGPPQSYDVTVLPLGRNALVTARDVTFDVNLAQALTRSRALYRDLVDCSADFAFETDHSGAFSFVSSRGALGYSAQALHGRLARELNTDGEDATPFVLSEAVDNFEIILRDASGNPRIVVVTARPVRDDAGTWRGARGIARDVTQDRAREAELDRAREELINVLKEHAHTDALTGLLNRRAFTEEAGRRLEHMRRTSGRAAVLYIDSDDFKQVNNLHGHAAGDELLVAIGDTLRESGRPSDIAARLDGDEFGVFLEDTDASGALMRAGRIATSLALRLEATPCSLSIGVAAFDGTRTETLEQLIGRADAALYQSKSLGKNRITLAEPDEAPCVREGAPSC